MKRRSANERAVVTVLFTDIVGSTEHAATLGDRRWKELLLQHHTLVREQLKRFGGHEIDTAGDGFLASFEAPERAVRCGLAVSRAVKPLGIDIRAGVHTGELEVIGEKVGGIGLHTGARVAGIAGPGEVLVSSTVKDLVAGSGLHFQDRGVHALKGIPGEWHLFLSEDTGDEPVPEDVGGRSQGTRRVAWAMGAVLVAGVLAYLGATKFRSPLSGMSSHSSPVSAVEAAGRVGTVPTSLTASPHSIAVLPFIDLSEKHDQEYFAEGMAEEILNLLAKTPNLQVIGRTSSFQFKGKPDDLRKIGAILGSAYILEGSVRRSGDHSRVTAQLIDSRDGTHRWSETYDQKITDAIAVQDEIASGVARALQVEVLPPVRIRPQSNEAYDHFLRGLHFGDQFDERGFGAARAEFQQALNLDPSFAPAAERLALVLYGIAQWGFEPSDKAYPEARAAAKRALELDPKSVISHVVLAYVESEYDWNWLAAERETQFALSLGPNEPHALDEMGRILAATGKRDEGLRFLDAALAADPLNAGLHMVRLWICLRIGRFAEAEVGGRRALEIAPTYAYGHLYLAEALVAQGKSDAALAELQKEGVTVARDTGVVIAYQALQRRKDAMMALEQLRKDADPWFYGLAVASAAVGKTDEAFSWLEKSVQAKESDLIFIKGDPFLKSLEREPRYAALLRKLNLPI
ncbi:MAG: tetratricopeptide repeat protein [Proteobacteria bacterium]|nr:tetratricopeptide repeat protein [Pseudomonadota bacterium]